MDTFVPLEVVKSRIYLIRGQKVLLDSDLALLYQIETKKLIQAVKRNIERFPADFMFQLKDRDVGGLRSQIVTSNPGRGGRRTLPYAFTEQGVAMLSSVLNSERAVQVNIAIMRAFVQMRELAVSNRALARKLESKSRGLAPGGDVLFSGEKSAQKRLRLRRAWHAPRLGSFAHPASVDT